MADPLYCVMRADHPVVSRPDVNLAHLASETWIMDDPSCSFFRMTVELCQAAGFEPDVVANTESISVYSALIQAGAGVAILPGLALTAMPPGVAHRAIVPRVARRIYAVCRTGTEGRPSIAAALGLLREAAETVSAELKAATAG